MVQRQRKSGLPKMGEEIRGYCCVDYHDLKMVLFRKGESYRFFDVSCGLQDQHLTQIHRPSDG